MDRKKPRGKGIVGVYLRPDEHELLVKMAEKDYRTLSDMVRVAIREAAQQRGIVIEAVAERQE